MATLMEDTPALDQESYAGEVLSSVLIHMHAGPNPTVLGASFPLNGARVELTFDVARPVATVFPAEVEDMLHEVLGACDESARGRSFPALQLVASDFSTTGVSVVRTGTPGTQGSHIVRLRRLKGSPISLFRAAVFSDQVLQRMIEEAIDDATRHIYLPLRNFGDAIDRALADGGANDLHRLRRELMSFKTEIEGVCFNFETLLRSEHASADRGPYAPQLQVLPDPT
ncbi:MAG: hypothetical protein AAFQ51_02525 [Pseudomonadota bacterium]